MNHRYNVLAAALLASGMAVGCGNSNPLEPAPAGLAQNTAVKPPHAGTPQGPKPKPGEEPIVLHKNSYLTLDLSEGYYYGYWSFGFKAPRLQIGGHGGYIGHPVPGMYECPIETGCAPGATVSMNFTPYSAVGEATYKGRTFEFGGMMGGMNTIGILTINDFEGSVIAPTPPDGVQVGDTMTVSAPATFGGARLGVPVENWTEPVAISSGFGTVSTTFMWREFNRNAEDGQPLEPLGGWLVAGVEYILR